MEREKAKVEIKQALVEMEKADVEIKQASVEMEKAEVEMEKAKLEREKIKMEEEKTRMEEEKVGMEKVFREQESLVECPVCLALPREDRAVPCCPRGHFVCSSCLEDLIRQAKY